MTREARVSAVHVRAFATRLVALSVVFALSVLTELGLGEPYSERQLTALYALVGLGFVVALAYGALAIYGGSGPRHRIELVGDGMLITGLVYCSGGSGLLYAFLFIIWIVYVALTSGARGSLLAWAGATAAYGLMVLGEAGGWLPAFEARRELDFGHAVLAVGLHSAAFLSVALLAHRLARQVQTGREELHELGEIHRRIVDNVSSGLLTVDRRGAITSFNAEAERITGCGAADVLGRPVAELYQVLGDPLDLPSADDPDSGRARLELDFECADGQEKHLGMSVSVLRDRLGREEGVILVFQDLTRIVEIEEKLRRSERLSAVGQLAAGLAHEIRNPLASLSGAIELLSADPPAADSSTRRLTQIVRRETARLDRLVSDFLAYARPGPGRAEPVSLRELVEEMRELLAAGEYSDVELVVELPEAISALGNPDQLRQILWNLILNAVQSEPSDGRVVVRARGLPTPPPAPGGPEHASSLEVEIQDRGQGIPAELLERVFEPFFTTKPKGTGLGLATVHRIVEAHGGELALQSVPGQGTTVRVILPAFHS